MSGRPSKSVLGDMLAQDSGKQDFATYHNDGDFRESASPNEQAQKYADQIYTTLAAPLKKVQQAYLRDVVKNCYAEKHMDPTFTNSEQIELCRSQMHANHWQKFATTVENARDSTAFRFTDCMAEVGNSLEGNIKCINQFVSDSKADHDVIVAKFNADYADFV